ncbi:hypothetical protein ACHAPT_013521 [Fusarium lateritium]
MPAIVDGRLMTDAEMIADGRRRLTMIEDSIHAHRRPNPCRYKLPPQLSPVYTTVIDPAEMPALDGSTMDALQEHGDPKHGYKLVQVKSQRSGVSSEAAYQNYIHEEGRAIICVFNYKARDETPSYQQFSWTDILVASCVQALAERNRSAGTMVALFSIWRLNIDNGQTQRLITALASKNQHPGAPFEICEDEPLFFALVASDHGRGIASLLRDYPWMFGFKTLVSATILPSASMPSLYWRLKAVLTDPEVSDTPPVPSSPMSRKEARRHRKTLSRQSNMSAD